MMGNFDSNINFQFQNIAAQLENIRFQINNLNVTQNELIRNGIEIINAGIQILNICIQLENTRMDMKLNYNLQIQNIGFQLQNMGMLLQQYETMPNMGIQNINFGMFQPFNQGMNMINKDNKIENVPKKTIHFEERSGKICSITLPLDTTVENAIKKYYEYNPEKKKEKYIMFIYNANIINVNDKSKIDTYFGSNPKVLVFDNSLKGG